MRKPAVAIAVLATLVAGACSSGQSPTVGGQGTSVPEATAEASASPASGAVTATLTASDITSDGKTVTVEKVSFTGGNGFIAWHKDANGKPGPVVGHSALLKAGQESNVKITLDAPITTGDYWPMLHADDNGNGTYDFPQADKPVTDSAGNIVMKKIRVTVK